ncbi:hypothetical protein FRX31_033551 [Thalictrum thalictroides]|uniref:Uncharacterized protein n=1 Tax=Thalictrum thalictroides TaxID=46969 RepID=A0A7J6UW75_THATH|nr:hypothetical protein FRX31_033551 [Thalictrum thalictroides]
MPVTGSCGIFGFFRVTTSTTSLVRTLTVAPVSTSSVTSSPSIVHCMYGLTDLFVVFNELMACCSSPLGPVCSSLFVVTT